MTCALSLGFGSVLVPNWFSYVFTYSGSNKALQGLIDAITLLMEAGYSVAGITSLILHLILPDESEREEAVVEGEETVIDVETGADAGSSDGKEPSTDRTTALD